MATSQTVPMIAPDGSIGDIPMARMQDAVHAGFQVGVNVVSPDGKTGVIPAHRYQEAQQAGFKIATQDGPVGQQTQFEQDRQGANTPGQDGTLASFGKEAAGVVAGVARAATPGSFDITQIPQKAAQIAANVQNRQMEGRSVPYQALAGATDTVLPLANARKMEDQADAGNTRGIVGTALADAGAAASPLIKEAAGKVVPGADIIAKIRDGNQVNVMPSDIGQLPPKVVNATENIFRAAAPTGMNKGFRANLYAAVPDLADIGREVNLKDAAGGIINPDMRVRATVEAIRDHLDNMYQTERAPQIQRNADLPVDVARNPNSARGLEYLETTAGDVADSQLATKALEGKTLSVAEADKLAMLANQTLKSYEKMTPEGKMQLTATSPKVGGLKALDQELSQNLNSTLQDQGEPGLQGYERRYAALSAIRDQLESRMNSVELQRRGLIKGVIKPAAAAVTGGPAGIASASQAAVADVNIGRKLQTALSTLADTDLTSKH